MVRCIALLFLLLGVLGVAPSARATVVFGGANSASVAPGGAISYVGSAGVASRDNCGDVVPAIPAGNAGDLLLALAISREDNSTIAFSPGWNLLYANTYTPVGRDLRVFIYSRIATGSDALTLTASGNCRSLAAQVARFRGVDSAQPFLNAPLPDSQASWQNSNQISTGTETTLDPNAMLLVASFVNDNNGITAGAGWSAAIETALNVNRDLALNLHYQLQTTAGAKSVSGWSIGQTDENFGIIFSLRPAPTSSYPLTIATPAGLAAGDLLLASVAATPSSVTLTPPPGWTLLRRVVQGSATSSSLSTYYRVADGSEPASTTWTLAGAGFDGGVGGIARFTGVDGTTPIDAEAGSATASSLNHAAPSVVTSQVDHMLVTIHIYASSSTWTPPGTMTEVADLASLSPPNAAGIALAINTELRATAGATGTRTASAGANADRGATQAVALRATALTCLNDSFNRADGPPGGDWLVSNSGGAFGSPVVFNNRLRLSDLSASVATLATLQRSFPAAGNRIEVEFDHYAYGGSGADGIAVILSDRVQTPAPGSYGGSLGYAQRTGPNIPGFAGGWLGIGLDEYGNFSNPTEGRPDGPGFRVDSVAIRGSGAGLGGYRYHAGTAANLNPQVDNNGAAVPPHRYRIIIDHSNGLNAWTSVERNTGAGFQTLIPAYDAKAQPGQAAVPADWLLSFTGSTGGSTNIHEIDGLKVCATYLNSLNPLQRFDIAVAATASTCAPTTVTLTARDAGNAILTGYTGRLDLSTSSAHGDWTLVSGGGVLNNGAGDDGLASYQFVAADNGTVTLQLSNPHADDLTIGALDTGLPASASTSIPVGFRDNALVLTVDPVQVAGRDQALTATLWRRDSLSGNCAIATDYAGAQNLKAWLSRDALDPGGAAPSIGGLSLPAALPAADNLALTFTAGQASFNLASSDVGKYSLNLRDDSSGFARDAAGNPRPIDGSSPPLTTRPFSLAVTGISGGSGANPGADTPAGAVFTRAGAPFQASVRGVLWQPGDDLDNNGLADAGADLTDNPVAASYAWPTTLSAAAPFQPAAGVLGTLVNGALAAGDFSSGSATVAALQYGEVGSMTLQARALGFLGTAGADLDGNSGVVGRFTPDHFTVSYNTPQFRAACPVGGFSYLGQAFDYATAPVLTVQARNLGGGVTANYTGPWWQLSDASLTGKTYTAASGVLDTALLPVTDPVIAPGAAGSGTLTFSAGGGLGFFRNAPLAPFDAEISLAIDVIDADGIAFPGNPARFGAPAAGNGIDFAGGKTMHWGRLELENVYGPELAPLTVPLVVQSFNGTAFVRNISDSCTSLTAAQLAMTSLAGTVNPPGLLQVNATNPNTTSAALGPFAAGLASLVLSAPGDGGDGFIDLSADLALLPWLRFDWDGNGVHDNDPKARASFGIYRGRPRLIYQREVVR